MNFYFERVHLHCDNDWVEVLIKVGPQGVDQDIVRTVGRINLAPEEWASLQEGPFPPNFCVKREPEYQ